MALNYNYFISQEDLIREPKIRVYTYESCPSREKKPEDRERYPNMYKIFNNKPSFGDSGARSPRTSQTPTDPNKTVESVKYGGGMVGDSGARSPRTSQTPTVTNKTVESVKDGGGEVGGMSQRPCSPHPHNKLEVYKSQQTRMPEKTTVVESVKYEEVGRDDDKKGRGFGEVECIDKAAAGFIEWKKRTLQFC